MFVVVGDVRVAGAVVVAVVHPVIQSKIKLNHCKKAKLTKERLKKAQLDHTTVPDRIDDR